MVLYENMVDRRVLLKTGVRVQENEVNLDYYKNKKMDIYIFYSTCSSLFNFLH